MNIKTYFSNLKEAYKLTHRVHGVLFLYSFIWSFLISFGVFKIYSIIWNNALKLVPGSFITNQNILSIFQNPLVIIIGILIIVSFCVLCLIQNAGIIMILEYHRMGVQVKLLNIFVDSFKQIKHAFLPKNWLIFIYIMLILPITDPNMAVFLSSQIIFPEYITDYIIANPILALVFLVFIIAVIILFFRLVFLQYHFILEKLSYKDASKKSKSIGWKQQLYVGITEECTSFIGFIVYVLLPISILVIISYIQLNKYHDVDHIGTIIVYLYDCATSELLIAFGNTFLKILVFSYMILTFHSVSEKNNTELNIDLPNSSIKTKGKIYNFRKGVKIVFIFIILLQVLIVFICVKSLKYNPSGINVFFNKKKIAAHKGYSSKAPENTMDAFELAANSKYVDYIELDIRSTKDNIPVVIHNESIKEATGEDISVYDLTLEELQKYKAPYKFAKEYPNAYIPTLEEVLQKYANKKDFILEIKRSNRAPDLPSQVVSLMEKYNITNTSCIHSGSYEDLVEVKKINPKIKCGYIVAISLGGYYYLEDADFFSVEHTFVQTDETNIIHSLNKKIFVWTVNETKSINSLKITDVDVLITDYPEKCAKAFSNGDNEHAFEILLDRTLEKFELDRVFEFQNKEFTNY